MITKKKMETSSWSIEKGGYFYRNVCRVRDAILRFEPGSADFLAFDQEDQITSGDSQMTIVVETSQLPVWQALQVVGYLMEDVSDHIASEVAWRISKERSRRRPPTSELVTNTLAALYECSIFLLVSKVGFQGQFLRGQGLPDLIFPGQRLLVECKDCQVNWSDANRTASVELRIRERIAEGQAQLNQAHPGSDAIKVVFVDLPDLAMEKITEMSEAQLKTFQENLVDGIADASTVFFTHFQVHQHLDVSSREKIEFVPFRLLNPAVDLHRMSIEVADLHNRLRYYLRGQEFPVPVAQRDPLGLS